LEINKNMTENTNADSLLRFKVENMLIRVASLVPIPEIEIGSNETRLAAEMLKATFKKLIAMLSDFAIK
jgi:hypothetical protein